MKLLAFIGIELVCFGAGIFLGIPYGLQHEETYVEVTCNNVNTDTVLNGTHYVCLTAEQWNGLVQRLHQLGT